MRTGGKYGLRVQRSGYVRRGAAPRDRLEHLTEAEERRLANVKWILKVVYGIEEPDHDWPDQLTRMTTKLRETGLIEPREEHDERRQA